MGPLLLVDVDGPLNVWGASGRPAAFVEHRWRVSWRRRRGAWLDPSHGPRLLRVAAEVGAELAWCTTWEEDANRFVGPALGLPPLRVVGLRAWEGRSDWKFPAVGRFAAGRPLAWLDDDFGLFPAARDRFVARRREPTVLVDVDPAVGVTDADLAAVVAGLGRTEQG
ncbi:hypothetical protein [Actinosynnema sp. NPDC020468]|uniref:hypothetical protein n=1 Tax=Actinosynnema sp. NPDC020468 TaxID=3154488 RepID=UPI0033D7427A